MNPADKDKAAVSSVQFGSKISENVQLQEQFGAPTQCFIPLVLQCSLYFVVSSSSISEENISNHCSATIITWLIYNI